MKFSHKQYVVFGWPEQMLDSYIWTFGHLAQQHFVLSKQLTKWTFFWSTLVQPF